MVDSRTFSGGQESRLEAGSLCRAADGPGVRVVL